MNFAERERIMKLEARITELERDARKCTCCEPVVRETPVHALEAMVDYSARWPSGQTIVRFSTEWGDVKVALDADAYRRVVRSMHHNSYGPIGTLRLELK